MGKELTWMKFRQGFRKNKKTFVILKMTYTGHRVNIYKKVATISRILYNYFSIMMTAVMNGHKVEFPGFGHIYIVKEKLLKPKEWKNAPYITKNASEKFCYNPMRPDSNYRIIIDAPALDKWEMRAVASSKWRKTLHKILTTTDRDYTMYK